MTPLPHTIGAEQSVDRAHAVMREHEIRHLPVLHGGQLVGIVTERDLRLVEALKDVDPKKVPVEEAMWPVPYTAEPGTPLDQVAQEMAEHKYGSVVVTQGARVVGVLTTVDVCQALVDALRQ